MNQLTSCQSEEAGECASNETEVASQAEIETIRRSLIQQNDTGVCLVCKEPISEFRLAAIPNCLHCISCQKDIDSGKTRVSREEMLYVVAEEDQPEETPPQPTIKLPKSKPLSKDEFKNLFK